MKMLSRLLKSSHITAWLIPHIPLALLYEKQTWNSSRYRLQEPSSRKASRCWNRSWRSTHWSAREGLAYASSRRTQLWWTRRNRRDARFRTTWIEDLLMYGQDLYFVTAVAVVGFVFLVVAMVLEQIFDRWKVLSRQPWLFFQYWLYYSHGFDKRMDFILCLFRDRLDLRKSLP